MTFQEKNFIDAAAWEFKVFSFSAHVIGLNQNQKTYSLGFLMSNMLLHVGLTNWSRYFFERVSNMKYYKF